MRTKTWMKSGLITLAAALTVYANPPESHIVTLPRPIGGIPSISEHVTYPDLALDLGIEGNVILRFRVDKNGAVSNIQIIQSGGYLLDQAAMAAVSSTDWIPAYHNQQAYSVLFQLPFTFSIE